MQVILFTHHASVVAAARSLHAGRPDAVFLHGEAGWPGGLSLDGR